jgi:hypothetical protein
MSFEMYQLFPFYWIKNSYKQNKSQQKLIINISTIYMHDKNRPYKNEQWKIEKSSTRHVKG